MPQESPFKTLHTLVDEDEDKEKPDSLEDGFSSKLDQINAFEVQNS